MISNGALQCTVVRSLKTNDSIQDFDWTKPWYLFYATSTTTGLAEARAVAANYVSVIIFKRNSVNSKTSNCPVSFGNDDQY